MSSRLAMKRFRRSDSSSMVSRKRRWSDAGHTTSSWRRLVTDAWIADSGLRRSWDTARRRAVRRSLARPRDSTREASLARVARSIMALSSATVALSSRSSTLSSGPPETARKASRQARTRSESRGWAGGSGPAAARASNPLPTGRSRATPRASRATWRRSISF